MSVANRIITIALIVLMATALPIAAAQVSAAHDEDFVLQDDQATPESGSKPAAKSKGMIVAPVPSAIFFTKQLKITVTSMDAKYFGRFPPNRSRIKNSTLLENSQSVSFVRTSGY